jgi:hypothetical protein
VRVHYLSATNAQALGDSARSAVQFEEAISILNQMSYYPGIEENQDFNDLSSAVIEDYEKYIAKIDSLSPDASIFALREKLNQLGEFLTRSMWMSRRHCYRERRFRWSSIRWWNSISPSSWEKGGCIWSAGFTGQASTFP